MCPPSINGKQNTTSANVVMLVEFFIPQSNYFFFAVSKMDTCADVSKYRL